MFPQVAQDYNGDRKPILYPVLQGVTPIGHFYARALVFLLERLCSEVNVCDGSVLKQVTFFLFQSIIQ